MSAGVRPAARALAKQLRHLARLYGVQTSYTDIGNQRRDADPRALHAVLRAQGAPLSEAPDGAELDAALQQRLRQLHQRVLPPVVVAWADAPLTLTLRRPADADPAVRLLVSPDPGAGAAGPPAAAPPMQALDVAAGQVLSSRVESRGGLARLVQRLRVPHALRPGYHQLRVGDASIDGGGPDADGKSARLLVAQRRVHSGDPSLDAARAWGVFLPVHAIRRQGDGGAGDLDGLEALFDFVNDLGGRAVGTLPLLALFLDEPFEPSPYSPASRLVFSELWLGAQDDGRDALSARARGRVEARRDADDQVDYRAAAARVRARLERESARAFEGGEPEALAAFRDARPEVDAYARFRATMAARGAVWHEWPERFRHGELTAADGDEAEYRYHLYAQWRLHERLSRLARHTRATGAGLYIDLPLGAHADGFDAWRYRESFAAGVSVGAPPDPFFTRGQDWGFPPVRPEGMLASGLEYTIATIRNHLRYAGVLRLDHVMGLHRQFWVPHGMDATHGVYVRYPSRALYAVLSIESHRASASIVGEDLGTVPRVVQTAMARHGVRGMHVAQFEAGAERRPTTGAASPGAVASLNTHDMPTFAAFWTGRDLRQRVDWGLLSETEAQVEREARSRLRRALAHDLGVAEDDTGGALEAWLERLAASDAALVLINLEDLWGETEPQNVPGTWRELPNWRRRAALDLERIRRDPGIERILQRIDGLRRGKAS